MLMLVGTVFRDLDPRSEFDWAATHRMAAETREASYDLYGTAILWVLTDESYHRLSCTLSCTFRPLPHLQFRQRESCTTALVQSPRHRDRMEGPSSTLVNSGRSWRARGISRGPLTGLGVALLVHRPVALRATNKIERHTCFVSTFLRS